MSGIRNDAVPKGEKEMTVLSDSRDVAPVTTVLPFADPGALGLGAFALTTFVLSFANAGFVPGASATVLGLALFMGGIAQFVAGIWEFANRNTFGATAFCSFGAFWMAFWFLNISGIAVNAAGVGVFLLAWAIFTAYMSLAAIKTNAVILAVFIALTLTFLFLAIGAFSGSELIDHIGGYLGIITAILAWYGSFATVLNSTFKRVALPVWPSK
jgi:succinate-acetate transporter protein